jgi:hypothetical protein
MCIYKTKAIGPFPRLCTSVSYMHRTTLLKESSDPTVYLSPCDHEVTSSNPVNNLLQKYKEKLHM